MNILSKIIMLYVCFITSGYAQQIEATLQKGSRRGQTIILNYIIPASILVCGYLYVRGKPEAREKLEQVIIGGVLAASAFGFVAFFR